MAKDVPQFMAEFPIQNLHLQRDFALPYLTARGYSFSSMFQGNLPVFDLDVILWLDVLQQL